MMQWWSIRFLYKIVELPATASKGPASIGIWNWAAPRTNNSLQPSSRSMTWSRNGSPKNAGTFFAHLTLINKSLAATSHMASGLLEYACIISCGYCQKSNSNCVNHWIIRHCNTEICHHINHIYVYTYKIISF